MDLTKIPDATLPSPRWIGDQQCYCHGAYKVTWHGTDSWSMKRTSTAIFYALDIEEYDLIFGAPLQHQEGIKLDMATMKWRFGIMTNRLQVDKPNTFIRALKVQPTVYALIVAGVNSGEKVKVAKTLPEKMKDFADVFSKENAGKLPPLKAGDHAIELDGRDPPYGPIYNLSNNELAELRRYLDEALQKGWIQHSTSPAGAPILFVPKKDGGLRLCVDYRGLNKVTVKNRCPLPLITETLDRLCGAKKFTKMDLKDAYHRIRIKEGDEWKTAFRTRYGHFEYLVMPFGLANAPATFQAYINRALAGLVDVFCVVYLDDILIYSNSEEEHWDHVRKVLTRLRQHQLFVNLDKCDFNTEQLEFLGFIVSTKGISMDPERVASIKDWPRPKTHRDVQVFLGFANFYRRFIYQYSKIASPLTDLLQGSKEGKKPGPLNWTPEAQSAFEELRDTFTKAPLLVHFDPKRKIRIETDASGYGIAGILSQLQDDGNYHPVAYWSRKMIPAERNYETHDQELLAIVKVFEQWRHYLEGAQQTVDVWTDHDNLRGFMDLKSLSARQRRWVMKLAAVDFEIFHRAGKTNPADPPSRRPDYQGDNPDAITMLPTLQNKLALLDKEHSLPEVVRAVRVRYALRSKVKGSQTTQSTPARQSKPEGAAGSPPVDSDDDDEVAVPQRLPRQVAKEVAQNEAVYGDPTAPILDVIRWLQKTDDFTQDKIKEIKEGNRTGQWSINSTEDLLFDGAIFVPDDQALRMELLAKYHDDQLAGHFAYEKTLDLLRRNYGWVRMASDVKEYVDSCDVCQRVKAHRHRPYGELQALPIPEEPWKEIAMDFITGLPPSRLDGQVYDAILTVVDRYTKMARYLPTRKKLTARELADLFFHKIVNPFGIPDGVVSDRGSLFTSAFWSELCYMLKIKRRLSTAFHPQTDGQTERQNQTLEHYLRIYVNQEQSNWAGLLDLAESAYNNSKQSTLKETPYYTYAGYHPNFGYATDIGGLSKSRIPDADKRVVHLQEIRESCIARWKEAQEKQAEYYNRKHMPKEYNVGDKVLLSMKNLKVRRASRKLSPRHAGPFVIKERIGQQAYRLELPEGTRIHDVFHVSLLETYKDRPYREDELGQLPELIDGEEEWEVEAIIGRETRQDELGNDREWYLVRWSGYTPEHDQWVHEDDMEHAPTLTEEYDREHPRPRKRQRGRPKGKKS